MGVLRRTLGVLLVPVVVIGAGGGYLVTEADERAQVALQTSELVAALEHQDEVLAALAHERALVIAAAGSCGEQRHCPAQMAETELLRGLPAIGDDGEPVRSDGKQVYASPSAQERTQTAIEERDTAFGDLSTNLLDPRVQETIDQARVTTSQISEVQAKIAGSRVATTQATNAYDMFLADGQAVGEELLRATADRDVALSTEAYLRSGDVLLAHDQEQALVVQAFGADTSQQTSSLMDRAREGIQQVNQQSELAAAATTRVDGAERLPPFDGAMGTVRELIVTTQTGDSGVATTAEYTAEAKAWATKADAVRDGLRADAVDLAAAHANEARSAVLLTLWTTTGALVLVIAGALVALGGSRPRPASKRHVVSLDLTPVPG